MGQKKKKNCCGCPGKNAPFCGRFSRKTPSFLSHQSPPMNNWMITQGILQVGPAKKHANTADKEATTARAPNTVVFENTKSLVGTRFSQFKLTSYFL
jgi:hypothetical protein